ncbi:MAG: 6-phosphogluconolactonase [Pseudomonadota bacterium]
MTITRFEDRLSASRAAALMLHEALAAKLAQADNAVLVVSGGATPLECFAHLAQAPLPWERIVVSLTDERCVAVDHADSNQGMLKRHLFIGAAARARYQAPQDLEAEQFAAVLLGMGSDGHFASLFADAENLVQGLDLTNTQATLPVSTAASPHQRISMSLARLLNSERVLLLAFGQEKLAVLDNPADTPVAHLLQQNSVSVEVLWAP